MVSPGVIGAGAFVGTGLAVGFGASKINDGIAERNPTGSSADGKARGVLFAAGGVGIATAFGGMMAMARGNVGLGAALVGGGFGAAVGAFGAGIAFQHRHGVGVETSVNDVMSSYNRDFDNELDLDTTWRTPEYIRRDEDRHEDSDGDVHYTVNFYSIQDLVSRADVNGDRKVTPTELHDVFGSYDLDGNGRLQGDELKRADREVGERSLGSYYSGWYS